MTPSFLFYDLETSGFSPRADRVMQFAGQRTDMDLSPIGKPFNYLIKMTPDILPGPDAVLLTGITPQKTISEGLSEAEFLKIFHKDIARPDTIFVGFNSIRFDDEFMRFLNWRNFYDAYEWQWKNGRSRWDLLDLARMTRALRPDGINWPFAPDGKPANRLEYLTSLNKISHEGAHDALSDVNATIGLAKLLKTKQADLFSYLLSIRDKRQVAKLVQSNKPFIYTSGHFSSDYLHTTAVVNLTSHPRQDSALVYDLRFDPTPFLKMSKNELTKAWQFNKDPEAVRLPVKTLKYNRSPAVAPLGVIKDNDTQTRLKLSLDQITKHLSILRKHQSEFAARMLEVVKEMDKTREDTNKELIDNNLTVDERLYDGFIDRDDVAVMRAVRVADPSSLGGLEESFRDPRLKSLLPLYKARNYPKSLNNEERIEWDKYCALKLTEGGPSSRMAAYFNKIKELSDAKPDNVQQYLLEELQLYGQSLVQFNEI